MLENTLPQLEQLIEDIINKNNLLQKQVTELEAQKSVLLNEKSTLIDEKAALIDENETLQLEAIDGDEKQKHTSEALTSLLAKLQSVQEPA